MCTNIDDVYKKNKQQRNYLQGTLKELFGRKEEKVSLS